VVEQLPVVKVGRAAVAPGAAGNLLDLKIPGVFREIQEITMLLQAGGGEKH
jgi:hypothetical protein